MDEFTNRYYELSIKQEIEHVSGNRLTDAERTELFFLDKLYNGYDFFGLKRKEMPITKKYQNFRLIERELKRYGIPNTLITKIKTLIN